MMWDTDDGFGGRFDMMHDASAVTWLMLVLMVALVAGLAVAVVLLVRNAQQGWRPREPQRPGRPAHDPSARRILDERLARGDIDEDDYRRRRAALLEDDPGRGEVSSRDA